MTDILKNFLDGIGMKEEQPFVVHGGSMNFKFTSNGELLYSYQFGEWEKCCAENYELIINSLFKGGLKIEKSYHISAQEKEWLKALKTFGFHYLVENKNTRQFAYVGKPVLCNGFWKDFVIPSTERFHIDLERLNIEFSFLSCGNPEPFCIDDYV